MRWVIYRPIIFSTIIAPWIGMRGPIIMLVSAMLATFCVAQTGNPFDITDGLEVEDQQLPDTIKASSAPSNVFEIDGRAPAVTSHVDTISPTNTLSAQTEMPEESVLLGDNPFNVDHVPIRRRSIGRVDQENSSRPIPLGPEMAQRSLLFIFLMEIVCLLLIALVLNTQRGFIRKLWRSLTNENILKLNQRNQSSSRNPVYLILYSVFCVNIAALIFLMLLEGQATASFKTWLLITAIVAAIYLVRFLALSALGTFFPLKKEAQLYSFTITTYNIALGLTLIPFIMLMAYGPEGFYNPVKYVALGVVAVFFLLRYLRGLTIGLSHLLLYPLHFLLYICASEIAPILLAVRLLNG